MVLAKGIVSVLQTPFDAQGALDWDSLHGLMEYAIAGGIRGFIAPAVASEVDFLSETERASLVSFVARVARGRVPFIGGASSPDVDLCRRAVALAGEVGAAAILVAVPQDLYDDPDRTVDYFRAVASACRLPLVIQDLQWNGPGLTLPTILRLREQIPVFAGLKIETVPAGPKYSAVKSTLGKEFYVCGGWAVPQMIEALDRGVDAMVPEGSMVRVYSAIFRAFEAGDRDRALHIFRELLPVLSFANQEIRLSIAFFKRLLVHKGIFRFPTMRGQGFFWDPFSRRIADELIELYLDLESRLAAP